MKSLNEVSIEKLYRIEKDDGLHYRNNLFNSLQKEREEKELLLSILPYISIFWIATGLVIGLYFGY